jgi:hypothetical protein
VDSHPAAAAAGYRHVQVHRKFKTRRLLTQQVIELWV